MLTRYELELKPERDRTPVPEWGYQLYAAMLHRAGDAFGAASHENRITPVSEFLRTEYGKILWTVTLLGDVSEQTLIPVIEEAVSFHLDSADTELSVADRKCDRIDSADGLFLMGAARQGVHRLRFCTPTAFKSHGEYCVLPSARLIVQSLIQKWNGCFPDCPIEDEDGAGMEALADGLVCTGYRLENRSIRLKGSRIPGFTGSMVLENHMDGFHRELADALLEFAGFSGIGIKTALGMGGVRCN